MCKHDLSYTPGITGTSAMRQHLINKHDIQLTSKARNSVSFTQVLNMCGFFDFFVCVVKIGTNSETFCNRNLCNLLSAH